MRYIPGWLPYLTFHHHRSFLLIACSPCQSADYLSSYLPPCPPFLITPLSSYLPFRPPASLFPPPTQTTRRSPDSPLISPPLTFRQNACHQHHRRPRRRSPARQARKLGQEGGRSRRRLLHYLHRRPRNLWSHDLQVPRQAQGRETGQGVPGRLSKTSCLSWRLQEGSSAGEVMNQSSSWTRFEVGSRTTLSYSLTHTSHSKRESRLATCGGASIICRQQSRSHHTHHADHSLPTDRRFRFSTLRHSLQDWGLTKGVY
ncbi:hypothetical protein BDP81DRAFT_88294 [Colletotrichum phormii]|uniref:Uncharacterized protein n=1 Tax=Colletotrichum phormii TaxID=359342 RepID=A0AAJ0EK41_9PEZI|nr:uncharacterized protein BDP81DRAFT_88294 [Colletotrichum phormii]KAK1654766.1 hypothetical protein BDP81DRAFT_88294 [Colletotrichum phormii]